MDASVTRSDPNDEQRSAKHPFGLPRACRLRRRAEFLRIFRHGAKHSGGGLSVYAAPNKLGRNRLGVSVGRKHGNAVKRNRIRRWLKEAFRLEKNSLPQGFDFICMPARNPKNRSVDVFDQSVVALRILFEHLARSAARKSEQRQRR